MKDVMGSRLPKVNKIIPKNYYENVDIYEDEHGNRYVVKRKKTNKKLTKKQMKIDELMLPNIDNIRRKVLHGSWTIENIAKYYSYKVDEFYDFLSRQAIFSKKY